MSKFLSLDESLNSLFLEENSSIISSSENYLETFSINDIYSDSTENLDSNDTPRDEELKIEDLTNVSQNSNFLLYDFVLYDFKIKENDLIDSIFRQSKNIISSTGQNETSPLKIFTVKRKGRQFNGNHNKIHDSSSFDNLQTKIQVHFFSFIINISNDALFANFGKNNIYNFKDISYKVKNKINYKSCDKYKNSTIKDILQNEISSKFKNYPKDINKNTLNKVCKISNWLNLFFNEKYIDLFQIYYNNENPLKEILFEGKKIILSKKTKTFYDLLIKYEKDKLELKHVVRDIYLYGYNTLMCKDSFVIKKSKFD